MHADTSGAQTFVIKIVDPPAFTSANSFTFQPGKTGQSFTVSTTGTPGPSLANFGMLIGRTTPVGLFPAGASPFGCHDMAGNVNNWTSDWYWMPYASYCAFGDKVVQQPHMDDQMRELFGATEITDKALTILINTYNGRGCARSLSIGDNYRLAALHHCNTGVGSS